MPADFDDEANEFEDCDADAPIERALEALSRRGRVGRERDAAALQRDAAFQAAVNDGLARARQRAARPDDSSGEIGPDRADPLRDDLRFLDEVLHDYQVVGRIHYGGQGVVYQALQRSTKRTVAVKILLDGPLATPRQRHRFAREVELVSRLRHPNIVTVYESGLLRGRHFFAMEFVDGPPIDGYVLLQRPSVPELVRLFVTVCSAVSAAHQHGVIHRDLKPANILVDSDGAPHILDFGLAKDVAPSALDDGSSITLTGEFLGTPAYVTPEHFDVADRPIDARSDVYALGVVLYRLLTGAFPYPVLGDMLSVQQHVLHTEPARLTRAQHAATIDGYPLRGTIGRDLEAVVLKSLQKDPTRRYQSAAAFADDLERCLSGAAVEAKSDSSLYILRKTLRKHRVGATVAGLFMLLATGASAAVTVLWTQARVQRDHARAVARLAHGVFDQAVQEIDRAIRPLAGGLAVRDRLLEGVDGKLGELEALVAADQELADLRGALEEKRGDIRLAQGRFGEAAARYGAFLEVRRLQLQADQARDDLWRDVARAHRRLAAAASDPSEHFPQAVRIGQALLSRHADEAALRSDLCETRVAFGRHLYSIGHFVKSGHQTEAALELARGLAGVRDPGEPDARLLAEVLQVDSDVRLKLGQGDRAIAALSEALNMRRAALESQPADVELRHAVLFSSVKLARIHHDEGDDDLAIRLFEEAIQAGTYLTTVDPGVAGWKRDLFMAHDCVAEALLDMGEANRARSHIDAAIALAACLLKAEPANPQWRALEGFAHMLCGRDLASRSEFADAFAEFDQAVGIRQELMAAEPTNVEIQGELALSYDWLGACCRNLGRSEEALAFYQGAHELRLQLLTSEPDVTQRAIDVILSRSKLATWHLDRRAADHDLKAAELLARCDSELAELRNSGKLAGMSARFAEWSAGIHENQRVIASRAARRGSANSDELRVSP